MGSISYFMEQIDVGQNDGQEDIALDVMTYENRVILRISHGKSPDLDIKFNNHDQMSRFLEALKDAEAFNFKGKET